MKRLTRSHCIPLSPTSLSFSVFIVQKFIKLLFPCRTCFQARQISRKITPSLNYTPKIKFSEHETLCSQLVCYMTCRGRNNFIKLTNTLLRLLRYIILPVPRLPLSSCCTKSLHGIFTYRSMTQWRAKGNVLYIVQPSYLMCTRVPPHPPTHTHTSWLGSIKLVVSGGHGCEVTIEYHTHSTIRYV